MKKSLNQLVNNLYTGKQKLEVKEIIKKHKYNNINDLHLLNYEILSIAFEDLVELSNDEVEKFYSVESLQGMKFKLNEVDFLIASIITTLENFNSSVKEEYENALVLDKTQPEFEYLVNQVSEYLSK